MIEDDTGTMRPEVACGIADQMTGANTNAGVPRL